MKKILLIEDNADVRENTAEILPLAGYDVTVAENFQKVPESKSFPFQGFGRCPLEFGPIVNATGKVRSGQVRFGSHLN
jgi:hypothetical protein